MTGILSHVKVEGKLHYKQDPFTTRTYVYYICTCSTYNAIILRVTEEGGEKIK
jgi:hypothetical protein